MLESQNERCLVALMTIGAVSEGSMAACFRHRILILTFRELGLTGPLFFLSFRARKKTREKLGVKLVRSDFENVP